MSCSCTALWHYLHNWRAGFLSPTAFRPPQRLMQCPCELAHHLLKPSVLLGCKLPCATEFHHRRLRQTQRGNHRVSYRMVWPGRDIKNHRVPAPAVGKDNFHQTELLRAPFNLALNSSRDGESTAGLDNVCQCLTTPIEKNFLLISNLNLPSFSLDPFPLVLYMLL